MIITIDGPAGTGKSTVAKKLAARLNFQFFDTGAMFRAVAWMLEEKKIEKEDDAAIEEALKDFRFECASTGSDHRYFVNKRDVTDVIRSRRISEKASEVATLRSVREVLSKIQREFGATCNAVFEGRDMGSHVFPHADLKIFLTARPQVRAERRYLELQGKQPFCTSLSKEQIEQELRIRDERDQTRELAPLMRPEGSIEIDTSDLTIDEVVNEILRRVTHENA